MKAFLKKIIPSQMMNIYYASWSVLGALWYRNPSAHIKVIGITGTNGKTSVAHITTDLFEYAGVPAASISTVRFRIRDKEWGNPLRLTMPGRFHIQRFFRQAVDAGCKVVVIEVTSEGIDQKRHYGIQFDTVVFTNLTPEHIERHGSFEAYRDAKAQLFSTSHRVAVINADDKQSEYFANRTDNRTILYSRVQAITPMQKTQEMIQALNTSSSSKGIAFDIQGVRFQADLLGGFNIENSLAAIGICVGYGLELDKIATAFQHIKAIPGRAEIIVKEPCIVVDYAHTPDGLEKMYEMVKFVKPPNGKTICVLGSAGGGRDQWKRPEMGEIVGKYFDVVIFTNEDPYDENPMHIAEGLYNGVKNKDKARIILDRREAIASAIKMANKDDLVVVAGKGSEPSMVFAKGRKIDWDDRKVVRQEWEKLNT